MNRYAALALLIISSCAAGAQAPDDPSTFAPFQQWIGAVLTSDRTTLAALYSTDPPAQVRLQTVMHPGTDDSSFWLDEKIGSMKVEIVRLIVHPTKANVIFRAEIVPGIANGRPFNVTDDQTWMKQGEQWRLVYSERTDDPKLEQPADMKRDLYPENSDAHAEIKEAEERAAKEHKRLLLVFGANWCFDCHVLDLAFHRPALAPVLAANYELVHVDIGLDSHKNADILKQFDVSLDKGVPVIAVADSDGKVVVVERNGEFEDARQLTPEFLANFLNQWKPQAR